MSQLFLQIINMSISASYIVLAVLLLRLLLKKAPKWITVVLWGIVSVRLVCPFSPQSALSLIPSAETVSPNIMMDRTPEINTGIPIVNQVVNPVISGSFTPDPATSANPLQLWIPTFAGIWILGMLALLMYTAISYARLKHKIETAVRYQDNIYQSENVASPFVLGLVKPKIYLPFSISHRDMGYVIAHEQAHIRRKDHLWKPIGFLLLTLHWFNPLMWLGYVLLCRDIELACDEKVVRGLDHDAKADYSQSLLTCSVNRRRIAACPLAFGEVGVKNRVKSVLGYKKPAFWIIIAAIVACVTVAVCFLTNPKQQVKEILVPNTFWECEEYDLSFQVAQNYVTEGSMNVPDYNGVISIGFRYAGQNAVAEIFRGDWEYAQGAAEDPLIKGLFSAKNGKLYLTVETDRIGLHAEQLIFHKSEPKSATPQNNLIYSFVSPASDSGQISYIYFHDFGCNVKDVSIEFKEARFDNGGMIFDIHWTNDGQNNVNIGPDFEVYKHNGSSFEKLESKGVWPLHRQFLPGKGMSVADGADGNIIEYEITASYKLSAHYDVLTPGKYRFEAHGAWIDFQILDRLSEFSLGYDSATFDVDGDGVDEICSMRHGYTSGLFTFIFLVHDKEGAVKYETVFYSQVYDLSFLRGTDGITRVKAVTRDEIPKTHLFDISIKDGYVDLTENDIPIGKVVDTHSVSIIYDSPIYSFVMSPSAVPKVEIEGGVVYTITEDIKARLGTVTKINISRFNFDSFIKKYDGFDHSKLASELRKDNKTAYEVTPDASANGIELYYVMEQKNGETLIVYGHYKDGEKENEIRFIYSITP